jgi:hypothetical protein
MSERFVTLTWEFIRDKDTTMQEKLILAEIEALSSLEKGCIASNEHFAKLLGIKKQNASRAINGLKQKGYIDIEIVSGSRNHDRIIIVIKMIPGVIKMIPQGNQNDSEGLSKRLETKENTPVNNPNNKESKRKRFTPPTLEEIAFEMSAKCHEPKIEAEKFYDYYESNGWKVGKNKMNSWKAAVRNWLKRSNQYQQPNQQRANYASNEINW